ncbi:Rieske (2Fe-2S) protein [Rubellimicrobium arenae]|uniref:Rieske (2Fe-2S) protein n=1 Tax=Rubellimicrobium arenae TaxID=2817372 RepID=UPI001B308FD1|nr:Rieske (2Fe-2S) protein [Rubellimicrobium arenae]
MQKGWYPLALSHAIAAGTSAGTVLHGQEIVVWRDSSGGAHTWEDRCPHRGMKMSFGFVRGDHIACLYHGWEYDQGGQCRYIPAHPKLEVPKTICVKTYPAAEAAGMIWVWMPVGMPVEGGPAEQEATGVRSLYLDRALDEVEPHLSAGFGASEAAREDGVIRLVTDLGPLRIGLQPVSADRCALHITLAGTAEPGTLVAVAARAEAFRRRVESATLLAAE